ncbi:unnamed protein product, partial [Ilex paraguariensis]
MNPEKKFDYENENRTHIPVVTKATDDHNENEGYLRLEFFALSIVFCMGLLAIVFMAFYIISGYKHYRASYKLYKASNHHVERNAIASAVFVVPIFIWLVSMIIMVSSSLGRTIH